eukprot:TRINITY_DN16345_c0_g1_i2.p1 TRINITY_DN16345_c0_g1~~TRINITY_DN16345_c0_g1_i2.p1  ORF type:complete len:114 (-),score=10.75 TRINITY_DN16345_c0_g1_i2:68-379(-)
MVALGRSVTAYLGHFEVSFASTCVCAGSLATEVSRRKPRCERVHEPLQRLHVGHAKFHTHHPDYLRFSYACVRLGARLRSRGACRMPSVACMAVDGLDLTRLP